MKHLKSFNESNEPFFPVGTKVKAKGRGGMEYGLIVPTPSKLDWCNDPVVVLWDNNRPDDYEQALHVDEADPGYEFKFIDEKGKQINRNYGGPRKGKNKKSR